MTLVDMELSSKIICAGPSFLLEKVCSRRADNTKEQIFFTKEQRNKAKERMI